MWSIKQRGARASPVATALALLILLVYTRHAVAQYANIFDNSDGDSPYLSGFGPDVENSDTSWDNLFPEYEGDCPPDLTETDDMGGNTTETGGP